MSWTDIRGRARKKVLDYWRWLNGEQTGPKKCELCRFSYKNRGEETPCKPCDFKPPELDRKTFEFFRLWDIVGSQWIAGGMGVVGLNFASIAVMCEAMCIDFDDRLIKKLKVIERDVLAKMEQDMNKK